MSSFFARSPIFWHFARRLAPWVLVLVVYLVAATVLLRWDMLRHGEVTDDFGAQLYAMYMQLFFEPTQTLPRSPIARLVFWVTPILGALLLVRGVARVGASVFDADERRRLWARIRSERMKDHIVVCGLGHVGIRVVESLRGLGEPIVAIERREADAFGKVVEDLGVAVLYGDARRDELLIEAGIERAKAVVCATDDDLTNLEVAIDSKKANPRIRVVMRIFDQRVAEKMRDALQLDETFSTSALSGPLVALQATRSGVLSSYTTDGVLRAVVETPAPAAWVGKAISACEDLVDGRIVAVGGKRPRQDGMIAAGAMVTVDLPADHLGRL